MATEAEENTPTTDSTPPVVAADDDLSLDGGLGGIGATKPGSPQQQRNKDPTVSTASADSDNEEAGHAMELALLQEMIHDREARMKQVARKTSFLEAKLERRRIELTETETKANEARVEAKHILQTFQERMNKSRKYLQELESNVRKSSGYSQSEEKEYEKMIRNMNKQRCKEEEVYDFVRKSQSQLCKAMHSMGILEHQLEIIKANDESLVKSFKEKLTGLLEEKSMVELKMMNELMTEDQERKELQAKFDALEKEHVKQVNVWHQSMSSMRQLQQGEESEESDYDSEDEIDEDLLREIIDERKEDVAELESLANQQQQKIQKLQKKLEELTRIAS